MLDPSQLQIITFDLDDTLWDNGPIIDRAVAASLQLLSARSDGKPITPSELAAARADCIKTEPSLAFDLTQLRYRMYRHILMARGYKTDGAEPLAAEATERFMSLRSQVVPFAQTEPMLQALRGYYRLGAITNGNCRFHNLPIARYFEFCVTPLEAQAAKPDPTIYLYTAKRYQFQPEQALHVGDCPKNDMQAAKAAGFNTAWFAPNQPAALAEADIVLPSLHSLSERLVP